ncbi:MAG: hypothetical protein EOP83_06585 [Verrucomicrobiaceae bacterium]|nr:MAG: hypothetical protein EOP83_06585 [Verrucomicrobiaceae bacterium]
MIVLLTLCTLATHECHIERMNLDVPVVTPTVCLMAQPAIAEYAHTHFPDSRVEKFQCIDPHRMEKDA